MSNGHISFRGDVEFLRGIAVALVVLFHLKFSVLKSGFIGVDIFFVISGFLMAAALPEANKDNVLKFYERRARRVLPAAFIIFSIFFIASPFLFLPFETEKVTESFLSAVFLAPNIYFWLGNDYFNEFTFRPMLHYWSLGVELQYYIVFPFIVYLFKRNYFLYGLLFVGSLLLCVYLTYSSSKTAFFMLPSRFWEFLIGFFAFQLSAYRISSFKRFRYTNLISVGALFLLLVASAYLIPEDKFPGIYALIPTLLAFIIIVFGLEEDSRWVALICKPIRFLGKYSYSIYLVHFPIIFLFFYSPFSMWRKVTVTDSFLALFITIVLSVFSYHLIEEPFRNRVKVPSRLLRQLAFGFIITATTAIFVFYQTNFFAGFYSKDQQKVFLSVDDQGEWRCGRIQKLKEFGRNSCYLLESSAAKRKFLLAGDSHMDAIKGAFLDVAKEVGSEVRLMQASCFLGDGACTSDRLIEESKLYAVTDLVLHGYNASRFNYEELDKLTKQATRANIKIHFIEPIPTYPISVPRAVYFNDQIALSTHRPHQKSSHVLPAYAEFEKSHRDATNVYFYDPSEYLCDEYGCKVQDETGIFYHDSHHLSLTGAKVLRPMLRKLVAN